MPMLINGKPFNQLEEEILKPYNGDANLLMKDIGRMKRELQKQGAFRKTNVSGEIAELNKEAGNKKLAMSFDEALKRYVSKVQEYSDSEHKRKKYPARMHEVVKVENGKKYIHLSVVGCFIDKKTGNIFKGVNNRTPKNSRGNIFNEHLPLTYAHLYRAL